VGARPRTRLRGAAAGSAAAGGAEAASVLYPSLSELAREMHPDGMHKKGLLNMLARLADQMVTDKRTGKPAKFESEVDEDGDHAYIDYEDEYEYKEPNESKLLPVRKYAATIFAALNLCKDTRASADLLPAAAQVCIGRNKRTLLMAAAALGNKARVVALIKAGAKLDSVTDHVWGGGEDSDYDDDDPSAHGGVTSMGFAAGAGHAGIVDVLVKAGASIVRTLRGLADVRGAVRRHKACCVSCATTSPWTPRRRSTRRSGSACKTSSTSRRLTRRRAGPRTSSALR
jgi:hypothetical protein